MCGFMVNMGSMSSKRRILPFRSPSGFKQIWDYENDSYSPFKIYLKGRRGIISGLGIPSLRKPAGAIELYVDHAAIGSGTGSTPANAFTTLQAAFSSNPGVPKQIILTGSAIYDWGKCGWTGTSGQVPTFNSDVAIILDDTLSRVEFNTTQNVSLGAWSVNSTYSNVYEASFAVGSTGCGIISDRSNTYASGYPKPLAPFASVADVAAGANRYYFDGATQKLYVRLFDDRVPDSDVLCFRGSKQNFLVRSAYNIYVENIDFLGGQFGVGFDSVAGSGKTITFNNTFTGGMGQFLTPSQNANFNLVDGTSFGVGIRINDISRANLISHRSEGNSGDGFAYRQNQAGNSIQTNILEYGCHGVNNGYSNATAVNGSSAHDGSNVVRVKGYYDACCGPVIADVLGSSSLNIDVFAGESLIDAGSQGSLTDTSFRVTDTGSMYCKNYTSGNSAYGRVNAGTGNFVDLGGYVDGSINGDSGAIL